ncbi:MAG: hypothetical protein ABII94_03090 [Patescibacteria group bacterium]
MKKKILILSIMAGLILVALFIILYFNFIHQGFTMQDENLKTILVLGIESRQKGEIIKRGWNDLNMLIVETKKEIKIISFPRDTLCYIPPKGTWIYSALYLILGAEGVVNYFNYNFKGLNIDNYIIYDLQGADKFIEKTENIILPEFIKKIIKRYKYINSWGRHRKKLKLEVEREMRIHTLINYMIKGFKKNAINKLELYTTLNLFKQFSEKTDFTIEEMAQVYTSLLSKPIKYFIWDGSYQKAYFNLKHPAPYNTVFWEGMKYVWILKHNNLSYITNEYYNPFIFSYTNFFMKKGNTKIECYEKIYGTYTSWNRGFYNETADLISDHAMTNQHYNFKEMLLFCRSYPKNKLSDNEIQIIYNKCRKYHFHFLPIYSQLQKESSLIVNESDFHYGIRKGRAMGYDCGTIQTNEDGHSIGKYHDFEKQIELGLKCMRRHFDNYEKGIEIDVFSFEKKIKCKNAATYCLYAYTPFYGEAYPYGKISIGNRRFVTIFYLFQKRYIELQGAKK